MTRPRPPAHRLLKRRRIGAGVVVVASTLVVSLILPWAAAADSGPPLAGSAGLDTSLPMTDSAVTVSGRGTFASLKVSVNQTRSLLNQAVSVTWTGAPPSVYTDNRASLLGNFLQIFQCWGDDDGTNAANPGPPPQNCEFGGSDSNPGGRDGAFFPSVDGLSRVIGGTNFPHSPAGSTDSSGLTWEPFHAVDGTAINIQANFAAALDQTGAYWLNPYFDVNTTNESDVALTYPSGTGAALFPVDTGLEAPGLGCGQKVQTLPDGTKKTPKCWLVIVPRGTASQENDPTNTIFPGANTLPVDTSPLYPTAWMNRIAIPLDFAPVDSPCAIGADERRIVGSELATPAVTSWQPVLCSSAGSPPYNYASISDDQARQQLVSGTSGAPGMAVVSRALEPIHVDPTNPVVYAPLTLSGVTIGFNIERTPPGSGGDPAETPLRGIRVAHVNLTPRLVAKLLTESYPVEFNALHVVTGGVAAHGYDWMLANPKDLVSDQDFVQYNPEFKNLVSGEPNAGDLVVEQPSSDAAFALWRWVLADPEATSWLSGTPDPWGMNVNPYYSTNAGVNPSGVFGSPIPGNFPKSDPYCYQAPVAIQQVFSGPPRPLCVLDASPYANSMSVAALDARAATDGAKTTPDYNAANPQVAWVATPPQTVNRRFILSVTDTASAARYGLQVASLSRAGDDGASRSFVAPDQQGLLAGAKAMVPSSVPAVLEAKPDTTAPGAYPLAQLAYAAVTPRSLTPAFRTDYAAFVTYAAGKGQVPGLGFGNLPPGYAPLPAALIQQATTVAALIRTGDPAAPTAGSSNSSSPGQVGGNGPGTQVNSTGSNPATAPTGAATAPPKARIALPATRKSSPTPATGLGLVRYTLPLLVLIGLAAAFGAPLLGKRRSPQGALAPTAAENVATPAPKYFRRSPLQEMNAEPGNRPAREGYPDGP